MNAESLKLTGRIINVNAADQSILIESTKTPNRIRIYANDTTFRRLNRSLSATAFNGDKTRSISFAFWIQGKVLMSYKVLEAISLGNIHIETGRNRSLLDFVKQITHAVRPGMR